MVRKVSQAALLIGLLTAASAAAISGCAVKEVDTSSDANNGGASGGACATTPLSRQPSARFVQGRPFYLPTVDSACGESWQLRSAPAGNSNKVELGPDGRARFTPSEAGSYEFELGATGTKQVLTVVAADSAPFENFNYYGSQSVLKVGEEIWVANVSSPTISRVDPATRTEKGQIQTGSWPVALAWQPGMSVALVAERGSDALGVVDVASGKLVDSIWVGDEPSNVVVSADGTKAYVALAAGGGVAVVDLAQRSRTAKISGIADPLGLALDDAGKKLYVASHRSAGQKRFPFKDRPARANADIVVIDTDTNQASPFVAEVGSTINALLLDKSSNSLFVAVTTSEAEKSLAEADGTSFLHWVKRLDLATGNVVAEADLSHQASSTGYAVTAHGLSLAAGRLWVAIEGSDLALGLSPMTLAEEVRVAAKGRPRGLLATDSGVWVHGQQGFVLSAYDTAGKPLGETALTGDPRTPEMAAGQAYFTGAGEGYGINRACNSCHLDGLMDGNVWKAGPFDLWSVSKAFFWLEGTAPLGWEGYLTDSENFAVTVGSTIEKNPTTSDAKNLSSYMLSLVPPPAANEFTAPDGSYSEAAKRGAELFEGKAGCASCHSGSLRTNKALLNEGISEGLVDTPSLIATARFGYWFREGEADLRTAVARMADWTKVSLSDSEVDDLTEYVAELGSQDFFVLNAKPANASKSARVDGPIRLTFSHPVFTDGENLKAIRLLDSSGSEVEVQRAASGRYVTLTPMGDLAFDADYKVEIGSGFNSFGERPISGDTEVNFHTAKAPTLKFSGKYVWKVDFPAFDIPNKKLDPSKTSTYSVEIEAEPDASGADMALVMTEDLTIRRHVVVDGGTLRYPSLPLPLGGTAFANLFDSDGMLEDTDGDGIADKASGTTIVSGPGFRQEGVAWRLERPAMGCVPESTGSNMITVDTSGSVPVINWMASGVTALGLYVTDPGAKLPAGPGMVSGGTTYWALQTETFPNGFSGPVTYGMVPMGALDKSVDNGAMAGGAVLMSGACLKFSVQFNDFSTSTVVLQY